MAVVRCTQRSEIGEPFQPFRWNHGTEQDPLVVGTKQDPLVVGWNCSIGTEGDEEGRGWYPLRRCCVN